MIEMQAPEPDPQAQRAAEVAAGLMPVIGTVAGGPLGGAFGAVAAPYVRQLTLEVVQELSERRLNSAAHFMQSAADHLEVNPDVVIERARTSSSKLELLGEAVFAASYTLNEQKIAALAKAVANGLRHDDARVDHERLIVSALAQLDEPHIKVLLRVHDYDGRLRRPRPTSYLVESVPGMEPGTAALILFALERRDLVLKKEEEVPHGEARSSQQRSRTTWIVSAFGEECIRYLTDTHKTEERSGDRSP